MSELYRGVADINVQIEDVMRVSTRSGAACEMEEGNYAETA